jgi:hypothetical protein
MACMGTTRAEAEFAGPVRPSYRELLEQTDQVTRMVQAALAQIEKLKLLLEKLRGEGKRQAAPFRKQDKCRPSRSSVAASRAGVIGRMPTAAFRPEIDDNYDAPRPTICSHCGGTHLTSTHIARQYQTEIPRRVNLPPLQSASQQVPQLPPYGRRAARPADLDGPRRGGESARAKRACVVDDLP